MSSENEILALEDKRYVAMCGGDFAALAPPSGVLLSLLLRFLEWCRLNRISERTGRRLLASGNGPVIRGGRRCWSRKRFRRSSGSTSWGGVPNGLPENSGSAVTRRRTTSRPAVGRRTENRSEKKALDGHEEWLRERLRRHRGNADVIRQELAAEKSIIVSLRTVERAVLQ
jgi:hypothetical protein